MCTEINFWQNCTLFEVFFSLFVCICGFLNMHSWITQEISNSTKPRELIFGETFQSAVFCNEAALNQQIK